MGHSSASIQLAPEVGSLNVPVCHDSMVPPCGGQNSHRKDATAYIRGTVEGTDMHILLDTGSSISFISENVRMAIPSLNRRPINKNLILSKSVTGQSLDTLGTVNISLRLGPLHLQHEVQVIRNVSQNMILGWDFLQQQGAVLDLGIGVCRLHSHSLPLLCATDMVPDSCTALVAECTTIPPYCEMHCAVKLTPPTANLTVPAEYSGLLEPYPTDLNGLAVARTLAKANEGFTVARVLNPTNSPIELHPGMQLGQFTPTTEDDISTDTQPTENDISTSAPTVCQVSTPLSPSQALPFAVKCGSLSDSQSSELNSLLLSYSDIFSKTPTDFGRTNLVQHRINTNAASPIRKRAYRTSPHMQSVIQAQVEDMLAKDIIEVSHSPWAAPVVMVRKKDGSWRFCVDYRGLNSVTVKDAHPLPRTDDTLDALSGASMFSTMDLSSGYWQVQLDQQDKEKTAFTTSRALYQFKVMPMGLVNAPPTFQHLMQLVLQGLSWRTCLVYLDDILVYSKTFTEHLLHLKEVFERLRTANLKLKPSKCDFAQPQVTFLGHVVSNTGLKPDPKNIDKVLHWPVPENPTEVRAFLGLCSYYRRFIHQFSKISQPLHALTQKGKSYSWTEVEQKAFDTLRHALTHTPILAYPDFSKEFLLFTDASNFAIGCVLSQLNDNNREHVIAYGSHTLTATERRWSTFDRELWAIVWSIRHFRQYLTGHSFRIITDHKPLLGLRKMALDCDPTGRRARWALEIDSYDWTIEHKQGLKHSNADPLSRRPCRADELMTASNSKAADSVLIQSQIAGKANTTTSLKPTAQTLAVHPVTVSLQHDELLGLGLEKTTLADAQRHDPVLQAVCEWVSGDSRPPFARLRGKPFELRHYWKEFPRLVMVDSILCRRVRHPPGDPVFQVVIPNQLRKEVFNMLHGHSLAGHFGSKRIIQNAEPRCYWPHMNRDLTEWSLQCKACEARRPPIPHLQAPMQNIVTSMPFEKIAADLTELPVSHRGNRYILVVMDYFTKYMNLYALPDQRATTVAKCLFEDYISRHGVPHSLHTDQGRQFDSDLVKELCAHLGVHKTRTSAYHPMSDGMVERANRSIKDQLAKFLYTKGGEWDDHLRHVEFAYNTSVHTSTHHTPFFLTHGREARLPADVILGDLPASSNGTPGSPSEYGASLRQRLYSAFNIVEDNIAVAGARQKQYYDRHMRHSAYKPGDLVWLNLPALARQKLSPRWTGPFKVLQRLDSHSGEIGVDYNIQDQLDPRAKPKVVHYNRLKPYRSPWSEDSAPTTPENNQANRAARPQLTALSASRPYAYRVPDTAASHPAPPDGAPDTPASHQAAPDQAPNAAATPGCAPPAQPATPGRAQPAHPATPGRAQPATPGRALDPVPVARLPASPVGVPETLADNPTTEGHASHEQTTRSGRIVRLPQRYRDNT